MERITRFALSAVLAMSAMLSNEITNNIWFDINVYHRMDRVPSYAQFVTLTWVFIGLAVVVFIWSFEGIFARFARKEEQEDQTFNAANFDDTW